MPREEEKKIKQELEMKRKQEEEKRQKDFIQEKVERLCYFRNVKIQQVRNLLSASGY
jgi:hypothetical protein